MELLHPYNAKLLVLLAVGLLHAAKIQFVWAIDFRLLSFVVEYNGLHTNQGNNFN